MKNKGTLVVVGMHRSGTSLTANWLGRSGLQLGDRLMAGATGNKDGHYEDLDFHDFHEAVFKQHGITYGGLCKTPEFILNKDLKNQLESLHQKKKKSNDFWGWKEPRTCLFLSEHHPHLINPIYLFLYRPCYEVVDSLWRRHAKVKKINRNLSSVRRRKHIKLIQGFIDSWIQYNQKILEFKSTIDENSYRISSTRDLLVDSDQTIDWANSHGFKLSKTPFQEVFKQAQMKTAEHENIFTEEQISQIIEIDAGFGVASAKKYDSFCSVKWNKGFFSRLNSLGWFKRKK